MRGVILGTVLAMVMCHTSYAHAQSCQKDNDCSGDLICNGGQCQTLSGATPPPAAVPAATGLVGTPTAASVVGAVTVRFEGEPALLSDKISGMECRVPCSMQMIPGTHTIVVDGMRATEIIVGNQGGTFQATQEDFGLKFGGLLLTVFGSAGLATGLVFTIVGDKEDDPSTYYVDEEKKLGTIGKPILLGGGAMLVGGIAMLASGDWGKLTPTATPSGAVAMPMIGVAPMRGGVVMGAAIQF